MRRTIIDFERNVWFWRIIVAGGIFCATVISGSYLSSQITGWQKYAGWILAALISILVYGGVALGVRGYRYGWLVALPAIVFEVIFDFKFLGVQTHGWNVSLAVGLAPAYLSAVAGILESKVTEFVVRDVSEIEADEIKWQRHIEERKLVQAHRQELARIRAQAKLVDSNSVSKKPNSATSKETSNHVCPYCGRDDFTSTYALGGHKGKCKKKEKVS